MAGNVARLVRGHLGFAFVSGRARRPSLHKAKLSGADGMMNRFFGAAVAVLVFAGFTFAQPPQAARQQQAQPSSQQAAQTRSGGAPTEDQQTTPEAQRPQFPGGQQRQQQPREQAPQTEPSEMGGGRSRVGPEQSVITHHTARIGGQSITYTANAATYIIRDDSGTPKAT